MWLHSLKVAQLLRSAACLHTNQSRSYLNHLVLCFHNIYLQTNLLTTNIACTYTGGDNEKVPQEKRSKKVSAGTTGGKYVHAWRRGGHLNSEQFAPFTFCGEIFIGMRNLEVSKTHVSAQTATSVNSPIPANAANYFGDSSHFPNNVSMHRTPPLFLLPSYSVPSHTSCADLFLLSSSGSHKRKVH